MNNRKFAFIIHRFQDKNFHGGGEKIMFNLIKQLCQRKFIVDVYCLESNVVDDYGVNNLYYITEGDLYTESRRLMQDKDYNSIISENINVPIDITIAMGHSLAYREFVVRNFIQSFFYKFRNKYSGTKWQCEYAKKYNKIFALSNVAKYDYVKYLGVNEKKVHVLYPGVCIPKESNISENQIFTFGLSAPGFDRKGGYIFLEALNYLKRQNSNFNARIIYPNYPKNRWIKFLVWIYGIKNNVEFVPFQSDMNEFYKTIDCLVMPSKEESFGMVATEAMANKKLVIVSSRCGVSEIITDGDNGFVFDIKGAAKNLAKKMKYALNNRSNLDTVIANGYKTAEKYSWEHFCNEFINNIG